MHEKTETRVLLPYDEAKPGKYCVDSVDNKRLEGRYSEKYLDATYISY